MSAGDVSERAALVALSQLTGVGPATTLECHRSIGAASAWAALTGRSGARSELPPLLAATVAKDDRGDGTLRSSARAMDPEALLARHLADGIEVAVLGEPGYPERLAEDPAPPAVVFLRGDPDALRTTTVAIVGTRNATRLGRETAARLAHELAEIGISIVSGLALGIDGSAHASVLAERTGPAAEPARRRGGAVAVVANGLDVSYPRRHRHLQQLVAEHGLLVSETPLGGSPLRWRFPARNRIIAGLADAVVVVESRSVGGSMSTAAEALARDVPLLAVPGHPTSPAAAGTLDLIADGAIPLRDVEDVLVALGLGGVRGTCSGERGTAPDPADRATDAERTVLAVLDEGPRSFAEVLDAVGGTPAGASTVLSSLEGRGLVVRHGLWYERQGRGTGARR